MNDLLYRQILAGLQGPLNPLDFEHCAQDLLQCGPYPTLSPVKGGSDAGIDALVDDGHGEGLPVVITADKNPIRNLTRSLDAQLKAGRRRRQVVVATATALTPQRQRNLARKAEEKGYELVQVYEQAWFADQLYRGSSWRKRLLDLAGAPPALSVVPLSQRPSLEIEPVGREEDLAWLRSIEGDRVLVGQPGSGKTFLLKQLTREGRALFLASNDPGAIADGIRDQRPKTVIVDDAHVDPAALVFLRHLRDQEREFSILAVTWPGSRDEVIEALGGLAADRIRSLKLLTRDEIVEIYRRAGLGWLDAGAMRELVDQAANKPGLAMTLAMLVQQGAGSEIVTGEAVRRNLVNALLPMVGADVPEILACFALGGEKGMAVETVATVLQLRPGEIVRKASALASAGVLTERAHRALSVVPSALRAALLARFFFPDSGPRLSVDDLLDQAPDLSSATLGLIAAAGRRVAVPRGLIQDLILRIEEETTSHLAELKSRGDIEDEVVERVAEHHREAWRAYAGLGSAEARWVLEEYPGEMTAVGDALLRGIPEVAVPRLLDYASTEGDTREDRERRTFEVFSRWIHELPNRHELSQPLHRRNQLAVGVGRFLAAGGDVGIGSRALLLALSPTVSGSFGDPGSGRRITISRGLLAPDSLAEIEKIWHRERGLLRIDEAETWGRLKATLWPWIYPEAAIFDAALNSRLVNRMKRFAGQVLSDLVSLVADHPGLAAGLQRMGHQVGLELPGCPDPVFEILYPASFLGDRLRESEERARAAARALARRWSSEDPETVADRIRYYEDEGRRIAQTWPRMTPELCNELAALVVDPGGWWRAFRARDLAPGLTWPLLRAVSRRKPAGWTKVLGEALASERDRWSAAELIFGLDPPPPELWEPALAVTTGSPQLVETAALRGSLPIANAKRLLRNEDWRIGLAAALGEWHAHPTGSVRDELLHSWRNAILRGRLVEAERAWVGAEHTLTEILVNDTSLSFDWLCERFKEPDLPEHLIGGTGILQTAVRALDQNQRRLLIRELPRSRILRDLLPVLVGSDTDAFRRLLEANELRRYHLAPLQGRPDESWSEKALIALDAGHQQEDIVMAAFGWHWSDSVDDWQDWDSAFATIEEHPDIRLREVARRGRAFARERLARSASRDRELALAGV